MEWGNREEALEAGKEMIRISLEIEADDDSFPEYVLKYIRRTVDPYCLDEEMKQLITFFYN